MINSTGKSEKPLAIILGASEYPRQVHREAATMNSTKFSASADSFQDYLVNKATLGLPSSRILNLFNFECNESMQQTEIRAFFNRHTRPPPFVIFYYVGHGSFIDKVYTLHIQSSDSRSGLKPAKLLGDMPWSVDDDVLACFLVDACFAAGTARDIAEFLLESGKLKPVVILGSSSAIDKSYLSECWGKTPDVTPFTEALLAALMGFRMPQNTSALSAEELLQAMNVYIEEQNRSQSAKDTSESSDPAPKPKLVGPGRSIPLFPCPETRSSPTAMPKHCNAEEWTLLQWTSNHDYLEQVESVHSWAFFVKTQDQFVYLRNVLREPLPPSADLATLDDLTVYELFGGHELLVLFQTDLKGARAVRDSLLATADESEWVQSKRKLFPIKDPLNQQDVWQPMRDSNCITAYCFPEQRSRKMNPDCCSFQDVRLILKRLSSHEENRAIKAFVSLAPKNNTVDTHAERRILDKIFGISNEYIEIVERVCYHKRGAVGHGGDLSDDGGFGLSFKVVHNHQRTVLIEILVPCGKFSKFTKFSDSLQKATFLDEYIKATYIAHGARLPTIEGKT